MSDVDPKPDAAPRPEKKQRSDAGRPRGPNKKKSVEGEVRVLMTMMGAGWSAADPVCGGAFMDQVPEISKAINLWAQNDPKLYKWLTGMTSASGPLAVAVACMPVAQVVAVHHLGPLIERRRAAAEAEPWGTTGDVIDAVDREPV